MVLPDEQAAEDTLDGISEDLAGRGSTRRGSGAVSSAWVDAGSTTGRGGPPPSSRVGRCAPMGRLTAVGIPATTKGVWNSEGVEWKG